MSTTLLNTAMLHLYVNQGSVSGVVLRPDNAELLCMYTNDGGTMEKLCDPPGVSATCVPGCDAGEGRSNWCVGDIDSLRQNNCAYRPTALTAMVRWAMARGYSYNELVLGTAGWLDDPVGAIEAIFYLKADKESEEREAESRARNALNSLVHDHPEAHSRVPILRLDLGNRDQPFSLPPVPS